MHLLKEDHPHGDEASNFLTSVDVSFCSEDMMLSRDANLRNETVSLPLPILIMSSLALAAGCHSEMIDDRNNILGPFFDFILLVLNKYMRCVR